MANRSPEVQERHNAITENCIREIRKIEKTGLQEKEFPVDAVKERFNKVFQNNDVILFQASTGAGKTLDLPAMVARALPTATRIAMTQPRRDAAEGAAVGIAARHRLQFGNNVSFSTSEYKGNRDDIFLQVQTTALLLERFRHDPMMQYYDAIIVDEAHERDMNIDLCLGLIKRANDLRKGQGLPAIKLVVASATIDADKFARYLGITNQDAIFSVEGRMHPVEDCYLPPRSSLESSDRLGRGEVRKNETPYTTLAAQKVHEILQTSDEGDILVFMPGLRVIDETIGQIRSLVRDPRVEVVRLHGVDSMSERSRILRGDKQRGIRRVVVSTNMAETSVTVPHIRYVVDSCRKNEPTYDASTGSTGLAEVWATRAECMQRRGRAGRIQTGKYYPLLTREEFNTLEAFPQPEIVRSELSSILLRMIKMGISDIESFPFLDAPSPDNIQAGLHLLAGLGLIEGIHNRRLTDVGKRVSEISLNPRLGLMVVAGADLGVLPEVIDMAAMLDKAGKIFRFNPRQDEVRSFERVIGNESMQRQYLAKIHGELAKLPSPDRSSTSDSEMRDRLQRQLRQVQAFFNNPSTATPDAVRDYLKTQILQKREKYRSSSEWMMYLTFIQDFRASRDREQFCFDHGLEYEVMVDVLESTQKIQKDVQKDGLRNGSSVAHADREKALLQCMIRGYAPDHLIANADTRRDFQYTSLSSGRSDVRIPQGIKSPASGLAIAARLQLGKGRDQTSKVSGIAYETQFSYALGLHEITPEALFQASPALVQRKPKDTYRVNDAGIVERKASYSVLSRRGVDMRIGDDYFPENGVEASRFLSRCIVNGEILPDVDFFLSHNKALVSQLDSYKNRAWFLSSATDADEKALQSSWKDLPAWYEQCLQGADTVQKIKNIPPARFKLSLDRYYQEDERHNLDARTPNTLRIGAYTLPVSYDKSVHYDGEVHRYVKIDFMGISSDFFKEHISDEEIVAGLRLLSVPFKMRFIYGKNSWHSTEYSSFAEVYEKVNEDIREQQWEDFSPKEMRDAQIPYDPFMEVPPLPPPVMYGVDMQGSQLYAYPALEKDYYSSTVHVRFWQTAEIADGLNKEFLASLQRDREQAQRLLDKKDTTFMLAVEQLYDQVIGRVGVYGDCAKKTDWRRRLSTANDQIRKDYYFAPRDAQADLNKIILEMNDFDRLLEERETLLPRIREDLQHLKDTWDTIFSQYASFGIAESDKNKYVSRIGDIGRLVLSPDGDPRVAREYLQELSSLVQAIDISAWQTPEAQDYLRFVRQGDIYDRFTVKDGKVFNTAGERIESIRTGDPNVAFSKDRWGRVLVMRMDKKGSVDNAHVLPNGSFAITRYFSQCFRVEFAPGSDTVTRVIGMEALEDYHEELASSSSRSSAPTPFVGNNPFAAALSGSQVRGNGNQQKERSKSQAQTPPARPAAGPERARTLSEEEVASMQGEIGFYRLLAEEVLRQGGFTRGDQLTPLQKSLNDLLQQARNSKDGFQNLLSKVSSEADVSLKSELGTMRGSFASAFDKYKKQNGASSVDLSKYAMSWGDIPRLIRKNEYVADNLESELFDENDIERAITNVQEKLIVALVQAVREKKSAPLLGQIVSDVVNAM